MRRRVDSSLRDAERRRRDVKLGHGGIREVEFVVQAQQLVHGGKDRRVRRRGTLPALERLIDTDYVDADTGAALAAAYRHLRNVENKIQIVQQRQSQTIPRSAAEVALLARRLGYEGDDPAAAFWQAHEAHTTVVRAAFEALFGDDAPAAGQHDALTPLFDDQRRALDPGPLLEGLGFRDLGEAERSLRLLRDGPRHAPASPRRRQAIVALGPSLLAEIARSGAPDRALGLMAEFVATVGARTSYLQLLEHNPATMRLLVRLFAGSEFLSRFFIRHPELLDDLVRVDLVRVVRDRDELAAELTDRLTASPDLEVELDVIRRFRHEEFLRIGIHDLEGELDGPTVETQLSDLAEVCLDAAVTIGMREARRRTGVPVGPASEALAVVALGKLGGGELNYHSDLDLVFVWDVAEADWAEPVHPQDFFTRVVQRTISVLQTPTGEGQAYQIDTRLRPSGNQGTLVTSLAAFDAYHRESAAVWERQALIKARVVRGPTALRARLAGVVEANVYGRAPTATEVDELQRIRRRIETERGAVVDIKTGEGGVVDVEFAVHLLQLHYGHEHAELRTPAIRTALAALASGAYVPAEVTSALAEGYGFLRLLENRLRIERDQAVQVIDDDRAAQLALARRLGYDDEDDDAAVDRLRTDVAHHRRAIREAYDRVIDVVSAA
jgi:glutamate-ammonia-ligase adenylyltransferase